LRATGILRSSTGEPSEDAAGPEVEHDGANADAIEVRLFDVLEGPSAITRGLPPSSQRP
jgi:hypothetical protein